ncbi:unnamed protein product [Cuscuta europaea]|uniref:Uncharacterized protein n=1 Tax=Cuscuta europaea TaxID=41803 RepID=A0A9P0VNG7_CUSEU|nr:unnamed protein product [Cuscuta europaea]
MHSPPKPFFFLPLREGLNLRQRDSTDFSNRELQIDSDSQRANHCRIFTIKPHRSDFNPGVWGIWKQSMSGRIWFANGWKPSLDELLRLCATCNQISYQFLRCKSRTK